ncbi:MAG: hypothetical protein JZU64_13045 [Rhodoferax sp.]|jgi:hypothetical protein|nr:hypothetical protein [Rhodoferax sp.]
MAIRWLAVLKMVPWGEVIENAPKVAQGAKKLWDKVGKKPLAGPPPPTGPAPTITPTLAQLQAQVTDLQASSADLHQQMQDCAELIQTLAEQNTQLVLRIEANRKRLRWLTVLLAGLLVVLAVKLF